MSSEIVKINGVWGIEGVWGFRPIPKLGSEGDVLGVVSAELGLPTTATSGEVLQALRYKRWRNDHWEDDFTSRLKVRRESAGLSQSQLADRSGLSLQMVAALEQGQRLPSFDTLRKLALGLGISIMQFTFISEVDLAGLPRWAQTAFAARCARRVWPLLMQTWPNAPREFGEALALAERCAANAQIEHELETISASTARFARAALGMAQGRAPNTPPARVPTSDIIRHGAAMAIARAAQSALPDSLHQAWEAYRSADSAALEARLPGADLAILQDFEKLRYVSASRRWTNDTGVDQKVFGPMDKPGLPHDEELP